jgi:hypothetical protein
MKDCLGKPVELNDIIVTVWADALLVPARVIALGPHRCQLLVEEPFAANRKVYRRGRQVSLTGEKYVPGPSE